MNEKINTFRDQLIKACQGLGEIASVDPIEDEVGVFAVELEDGTELFVEVTAA